jgi:hypothetical protein
MRERALAGVSTTERRGRTGGRPCPIDPEKLEAIIWALEAGATKTSLCVAFDVSYSTLNDALARSGWKPST